MCQSISSFLSFVSQRLLGSTYLAGSHHLEIIWIIALEALDEGLDVGLDVERVLAGSLLPASPAGVPIRVDVGRPVVQTGPVGIVEGARLGADHGGDGLDQVVVKGRPHQDRLRERGGIGIVAGLVEGYSGRRSYAMKSLLCG